MSISVFAERVKRLRMRSGLGLTAFYARYGISLRVGRSWEESPARQKPDASAVVLVMLIEESPDTIAEIYRKALAAQERQKVSTHRPKRSSTGV